MEPINTLRFGGDWTPLHFFTTTRLKCHLFSCGLRLLALVALQPQTLVYQSGKDVDERRDGGQRIPTQVKFARIPNKPVNDPLLK